MWIFLGVVSYFAIGFMVAVLHARITHEYFREEAAGWLVAWPLCAIYAGSAALADLANNIARSFGRKDA